MGESFRQVVTGELGDIKTRRKNSQIPAEGLPDLEKFLPEEPHRGAIWADVIEKLTENNADEAWKDADRATQGVDDEGRRYGGHGGLVGLAFSGGGIRSATFNLGVLQALHRCGLWPCIDYLSTVSGGGYLGSCLSSVYAAASQKKATTLEKLRAVLNEFGSALISKLDRSKTGETDGDGMPDDPPKPSPAVDFPFRHERGKVEPPVFRHLRNNANYIAPKGILDLLRTPAVLFRGTAINFVVVLPYILFGAMFTVLAHPTPEALEQSVLIRLLPISGLPVTSFPLTLFSVCLLLLMFALYPLGRLISLKNGNFGHTDGEVRNYVETIMSWLIVAIFASALIEAQPLAVAKFDGLIRELREGFMGLDWTTLSGLLGGVSAVLTALSAGPLARNKSGLVGQIGIYLLGFLGVVLLWLLYLVLCRWAIFPELPDWAAFLQLSGKWLTDQVGSLTANGPTQVADAAQLAIGYGLTGIAVFAYSIFSVDINSISLHTFYRDRLSRAYVVRCYDGEVEPNDLQTLGDLNTSDAPYHLINAAINVTTQKEAFKRGRQADTFLFSKNFIGGPTTGYCKTRKMQDVLSHLNLATAMAISGAAFAATAGKATIRPLAFVLAMLNVRLNYWLPNPGRVAESGWLGSRLFGRVGPFYLIRELFNLLSAKSSHVDISDGGHFENLGVYELLRRECRLIIVGDGECDPGLRFEAVSELCRLAQIDMGIHIEIDGLDAIRAGEQHHAIGTVTVTYSKGRTGVIIYLKSSMLKDDGLEAALKSPDAYLSSPLRDDDRQYDSNPYIAHYKSRHPDFPHQTTADQFFDERQFECYRALGFMVAMRTIGDWPTPKRRNASESNQTSEVFSENPSPEDLLDTGAAISN